MTMPALSLEGIRVLDLSRVLAGPFCGMLLSDLGADVIKIEDTASGDESRTWPPHKDGESAAFLVINRNKRDMTLDLKAPEGVAILKKMVASADVLIENFRTGTMESFGLGYDALSAINPRLVYASVSAFGRTGPRKDGAGYEALMQAFSGIMSITGEPGGQPVRAGVSFLDLSTGILCALGVCAALLQRQATGLGQRVDGSLLETEVSLLAFHAEGYLLTGALPRALGSGHPSLSPYRNFKCGDGQWIFIAAANDRFWGKLARALGLEAMATDPRFAKNQDREVSVGVNCHADSVEPGRSLLDTHYRDL
jgi:crotonobetainyl-CoA:carnitine CoA-transferase CaiB-like acyl-CoA transferase